MYNFLMQQINFDDTLYYLHQLTKLVRQGFELDIANLRQKLFEDIFFIDTNLLKLCGAIIDNRYLKKRRQLLRNLIRIVGSFEALLKECCDGDIADAYREKFTAQRSVYHATHERLKEEVTQENDPSGFDAAIISEQEYERLINPQDED